MPDYKQEVENISKFLAQYNENAGTNGFVLGCSGGIDSALCLALLKRGVHSKNIIAVALPCNSSENSLLDAQKLADNLNIKLEVIDLQNSYNSIIENLEKTNNKNKEISNLVKGNLAARLRMVQLYTMANLNHMLVCGTSNRSEIKVGYGTKFGDFAEDLSPLGNIYKTQVFEIAKLMPEIPKAF